MSWNCAGGLSTESGFAAAIFADSEPVGGSGGRGSISPSHGQAMPVRHGVLSLRLPVRRGAAEQTAAGRAAASRGHSAAVRVQWATVTSGKAPGPGVRQAPVAAGVTGPTVWHSTSVAPLATALRDGPSR